MFGCVREGGIEDVAVGGVDELVAGEPEGGEGEGVVGFAGVGEGVAGVSADDVEVGGGEEHARTVELDEGKVFAVGGDGGGFEAALVGIDGQDGLLVGAGEVDGLDGVGDDAGAADEDEAFSTLR